MSVLWAERGGGRERPPEPPPEPVVNYSEAREALADEICRHPSVLGRLVAIASSWDEESSRYRHKLATHFGTEETDRALRRLHQETFIAWLSLPLRQQQADVSVYLGALGIKAEWFDFKKMGTSCIPKTATLPERDLFLLDLDLIQALLRY